MGDARNYPEIRALRFQYASLFLPRNLRNDTGTKASTLHEFTSTTGDKVARKVQRAREKEAPPRVTRKVDQRVGAFSHTPFAVA
eukprot:scaffold11416_cov119-Isochrysis_galbana.AAC.5